MMKVKPPGQMKNFYVEVYIPNILEFIIERGKNNIPHLKEKKCKMWCISSGLLVFLPMPNEPTLMIDVKLGKRFNSSKGKYRVGLIAFLPFSQVTQGDVDLKLGRIFKSSMWRNKW